MRVDATAALVFALAIGLPLVLFAVLGLGWLEGVRTRRRQNSIK